MPTWGGTPGVALLTMDGPLTINHGSIATDIRSLDITVTWNGAGVAFTGIRLRATDTDSAAGSNLIDLGTAASGTRFAVRKDGQITPYGAILPVTDRAIDVGSAGFRMRDYYGKQTNLDHGSVSAVANTVSTTQTWNNAAVTFTHHLINVVDTNSAAASLMLNIQKSSTAVFQVRKDGGLGIGAAVNNNRLVNVGGTFTGVTETMGLSMTSTLTPAVNQNAEGIIVECNYQKAASGSHGLIAGLWIRSPSILDGPNILAGAATIGSTAGLYLANRPGGGTNNYAIWVEDGDVRLGGGLGTFQGTSGGGIVAGYTGPEKKIDARIGTNTTIENPFGIGVCSTVNTIGEVCGISFGFNNTYTSAAITAVEKETTDRAAHLVFSVRDEAGAGATNQCLELTRDTDIADTQTALIIRRNVAGTFSMQRVSMGAVDSGGAGFKLLRVPN